MHLLDPVGDQLLQFRDDNRCNTLDELFHLVEALLLFIHVLLLQLCDQVTQDVVFLVVEPADHGHAVDG